MMSHKELKIAVAKAAGVDEYLCLHEEEWPKTIRAAAYAVWEALEKELTRREDNGKLSQSA